MFVFFFFPFFAFPHVIIIIILSTESQSYFESYPSNSSLLYVLIAEFGEDFEAMLITLLRQAVMDGTRNNNLCSTLTFAF